MKQKDPPRIDSLTFGDLFVEPEAHPAVSRKPVLPSNLVSRQAMSQEPLFGYVYDGNIDSLASVLTVL